MYYIEPIYIFSRVRRSLSDSDLDLEEEAQNGVSPLVTRTTYASKTPKPTAMESLDFYNSRNADDHQSKYGVISKHTCPIRIYFSTTPINFSNFAIKSFVIFA